jgi:hypothetical protein
VVSIFTFSFFGTGLIAGFHEEGVHQNENGLPRRISEGSRAKKRKVRRLRGKPFFRGEGRDCAWRSGARTFSLLVAQNSEPGKQDRASRESENLTKACKGNA